MNYIISIVIVNLNKVILEFKIQNLFRLNKNITFLSLNNTQFCLTY